MSEALAEVCLVRCPKCESLLPEVIDYSVYQCGGCGTVLRASRKPIESAKISNEENRGVSNINSKELQNINFSNQKIKSSSFDFDQDDVKHKESTQIDQEMGNLKMNQESGNSGPQINNSRRPFRSSIQRPRDAEDEILRKLDEIKDQIVRSKEKTSLSNNLIRSRPPVQAPYHPFFSGHYLSRDSDNHTQFHHPLCSCLICYTNHHHTRPPPPPVYYCHDYRKPYTQWSGNLHRPQRGVLAAGGRRCRLVAGGSPFVACCNCFELIQIPTKSTGKTPKKLRCAACSDVILISVVNKKLVSNPGKGIAKNIINTRRKAKRRTMEFLSNDFDVSGDFDFKWLDRSLSSPPSGSSLQDHFDYSPKYNKSVSRQYSMKDVATEIEVFSQESLDQRYEAEGHESFFLGMIKKSFKLSRSNLVDHGKVNEAVTMNGHPLSQRVVKKAEKLSGPIQPGDYWYDSRAGFWGMMGGPCRGIIPPYIEEFNFAMPKDCADGHTCVFVNGRELHEKDLDLLASRGLPTDRDRSYIIEISGRVLEEGSGSELLCLGKLAPTVENKKHGFGMKPQKTMA